MIVVFEEEDQMKWNFSYTVLETNGRQNVSVPANIKQNFCAQSVKRFWHHLGIDYGILHLELLVNKP